MKLLLHKFSAVSLLICFVVSMSGCTTPYKMHPDFKERHKDIKSASIMPPEVDAYILTFKGDKNRLHDLIPIMEKTTIEQIETMLSEKGYEIKKMDLSKEALKSNPELRTSLFNARKLFEKALKDISKKRKRKFTYSVGSDVNAFADLNDCDVLIFVKEEGIKKSAGEIAKDVAKGVLLSAACLLIGAVYIPIPQVAATLVHIAIVDANDGDILWYTNNSYNVNWDPENQKHLQRLVKSLLKPFPDSAFKEEKKEKGLIEEIKVIEEKESLVVPVMSDPIAVQR